MQKMEKITSQTPLLTNMENVMTSRNLRETDDICEHCGEPIMESVIFIFNRTMAFKIMCPCIRAEIRKRDAELEQGKKG